jgi:hypothetical protein
MRESLLRLLMQVGCADEADTISYLSLTGTLVGNGFDHDRQGRRLERIAAPGTTRNGTPDPLWQISTPE